MKKRQLITAVCLVALMAGLITDSALAQAPSKIVKIRGIDGRKVRTPDYKISGGTVQGQRKDWFALEVEYDTAIDWADGLDLTYYIVMEGKDPKFILFRGTVSYQNIEKGRRHKSIVYLHPSTLERYGSVKRAAVLVNYEGRVEAMESTESGKGRWWEQLTPVDGMILNRLQSPFAMINFDDYEDIKQGTRR